MREIEPTLVNWGRGNTIRPNIQDLCLLLIEDPLHLYFGIN